MGVAVTELAVWGRRKAALASGQEAYLAGIREATQIAATGGSGTRLVDDVGSQLERILGVSRVRFEYGTAGLGEPARLRRDGEVEWRHKVWDVDRRGLPTGVDIELLVEYRGRLTGRYLMRANPDSRPTRSERLVAMTLASQVAPRRADAPGVRIASRRAPSSSGDRQGGSTHASRRFDTGMADVAFVLLSLAVFARARPRGQGGREAVTAENIVGLVLSALTVVYLVVALVFPEKF